MRGWRRNKLFNLALSAVMAAGLITAMGVGDAGAQSTGQQPVQMAKAQGQTAYSIGSVTVQSTKMDKEVSHITDAVTIIPEYQIALSGINDFTDLIRFTPSVQFKRVGGPGQYVYTKMRGFGDGHFAVLVDGMKVNEGTSAGTGNFYSKLDPFLIGRIELLRGPQAVLYGSDTTAGVMSITTKGGLPGNRVTVGGEYGTFNWKKGYAGFRGETGGFRYSLNAIYVDSDGIHEFESFKNFSPQIKIGYSFGDTLDIEASYLHIQAETNYAYLAENYAFCNSRSDWWAFQVPDPERQSKETYDLATLHIKHKINDSLRHKVMLGWYRKQTESNNPNNGLLGWVTAPGDGFTLDYSNYYSQGQAVPVYDDGDGKPYFFENENLQFDYNFIWDQKFSGNLNTLMLGLGYLRQEGKKWGKYGEAGDILEAKSVYLNDQLLLFNEALVIAAGIRYDSHQDFGGQTTYKLGAAYTFQSSGTTLFANYGTSFRAPTIFNLYDPKYGNPDLDPEKGWTVEGGVRQTLLGGKFRMELAVWKTDLDDVIAYQYPPDPSGTGTYVNRDSQHTQGVEFSFSWNFYGGFTLLGNYTYTDSETENDGETSRTVQIARNTANLGLQYNMKDRLFLSVHCYYSGPRLRWRGDVEMKEYIRIDVAGRYHIWDGLSVFARVNNLFDADIEEGLGYESPGINMVAGLQWDFNLTGGK